MTVLAALVPGILSVIGMAILQGIIALEVARGTIGEKLRLRGLWRSARGRIGALIGWSLLVVVAVTISVIVVIALIALVVSVGGTSGVIAGVVMGFVAFGAAAVLAAWLTTRLAFVPSALMLERLSLRNAIRRSWTLSTGYFWRTFGILLLVGFILYMVSNLLSFPLGLVTGLGSTLINPNGSDASSIAVFAVITVLSFVITIVFSAISAVIQTATSALLYIDLRMRREGLDLELTRFVEARQAGDTAVENPYLVGQPPTPAGQVS
jgi:membrane-anchored glycerophosphoryl diester phosphodiesterase (GDPDase)